jgi:putative hemolysin
MSKKDLAMVEGRILNKLRSPRPPQPMLREMTEIAAPLPYDLVRADLDRCELLLDTSEDRPDKGNAIYRARGAEIPNLMLELGRLREETFRTVGEGSGQARDLDKFDDYYEQFIGWDKGRREITGAYRIGKVDEILADHGPDGVYTNMLFNLEELFRSDFRDGTLEAGRSFVRPEYQRGPTLLVIWMALARYIAQNPRYKYLIGPVSISSEFQENSKHLMVSYLMKYHPHEKSDRVTSKNPPKFESNLSPEDLTAIVDAAINLGSLQELVREAEGNPRAQIPQLIKLYLELGVRFLAFNEDQDFNSVDGLIWLDVTQVPASIITRYMGEDNWTAYSEHHMRR